MQKETCCCNDAAVRQSVQDYYGKVLRKTSDLKTNVCKTNSGLPDYIQPIYKLLSNEVTSKYYGCGLCVPEVLEGCKVLDLGCGAGRDCYIISKLVGPTGKVIGVDMTPEQLETARNNIDIHADRFAFPEPNVEFKLGYIENLGDVDLKDNYFDCIVSNCVINLSPDKESVLHEAYRVLKPGGELYFSDVYASRRIPQELLDDEMLFGECLSGALFWNDFLRLALKHGFSDPRLVSSTGINIGSRAIEKKVGNIRFNTATFRLFKIPELEYTCEDYGQAVSYKGSVETSPYVFILDKNHRFEKGRVISVCGNTFKMLHDSRFKDHFQFFGSGEVHYGAFSTTKLSPHLSRQQSIEGINENILPSEQ